MADESMVRNLAAQADAIWPQEEPLFRRYGQPARILDVGCGTGEISSRLATLFPAARVTGWIRRDLAINFGLFLLVAFTLLDGIQGSIVFDLRVAGAIAFFAAFVHPVLVDQPHANHHRADPAGSPVPQYMPPACLWIDWLTAALVLAALFLL